MSTGNSRGAGGEVNGVERREMSGSQASRETKANGAAGKSRHLGFEVAYDPKSTRQQHRRASFLAPFVRGGLRPLGKIAVRGAENIPQDGPLIVASYHQSNLDPLIVGISIYNQGRLPRFMAKHTLFTFPVGLVARPLGQIPVVRGSREAGDSLAYAEAALEAGQTVTIYPEGTHTKDPDMWPGPAKSGTARLALRTGTPIVTVAHWGVQDALPGKSLRPRLGPSRVMTVDFSEPIVTEGVPATRENVASLTEHITARIASQLADLRGVPLPDRFHKALEWRKA